MYRERFALWSLLAAMFAIRAIYPDQPIVENYVGRQIPTAMVARNLERGSGFLNPQLDTGPFPNLFLVEPPIYAQVVASIRPVIGLDLESTGRLVSAAATTLAAWGLFGLARRREGPLVALLALGSFGIFPVMIRYGRAFQPDALMLGCVLVGLRGWDEFEDRGDWRWAVFGGFVLSTGLALKVTSAWALIPFVLIVRRWPIGWRLATSVAMLIPAAVWYLMAWDRVATPSAGSLASTENARIWARSVSLKAWVHFGTYIDLGRNLLVRSFTPVGFVLAICGLRASGKLDRLWVGWGLGCGLSIVGLATKWHHSYYWMAVAPLAAVCVGRCLVCLAKSGKMGRFFSAGLGSSLLGLCLYQSASTFRTPHEWANLIEAAGEVKRRTPMEQLVIAPEALLYYADCRGYRLEFEPAAMSRAASEWSGSPWASKMMRMFDLTPGRSPKGDPPLLALVDFYQAYHENQPGWLPARFGQLPGGSMRWLPPGFSEQLLVADPGPDANEPRRRAWREAVRARPGLMILIDRPDFFLAELR